MLAKTPEKKLNQIKAYNSKLVYHRFQALKNSERGKLLAKAKKDEHLLEKFWQFLEQEYAPKKRAK